MPCDDARGTVSTPDKASDRRTLGPRPRSFKQDILVAISRASFFATQTFSTADWRRITCHQTRSLSWRIGCKGLEQLGRWTRPSLS